MEYRNLEILVSAICDAIAAACELVNHDGLLSLLKYGRDLSALAGLSAAELKAEILALTPTDRSTLESLAKAKLSNVPQAPIQTKLDSGIDLLELVFQFGLDIYGKYQEGLALVNKIKDVVTT